METKQKFLQLQFCTLLVVCTLLPDLGSLVGSLIGMPDFDIPVFCCQIIGIVGGGLALFKIIMKMMEKHGTEIIYVRGNHDDFLDNLAPLQFANLTITKDYILESNGKHYFVTHGDVFDKVTTSMKWLAKLGDIGYTLLLWLNSQYNRYRVRKGKPYYSLSQAIKQKVKSAVSYISDFENVLVDFAKNRQCEGVICGHIHHPENRMIDQIHYLNSGDWVETMSALTEDENGEWKVIYYTELEQQTPKPEENNVIPLIPIAS